MVTPVAKREAVARLRSAFEVSERRACSVLGVDRTSVRYRSRRASDAAVRARLRELAAVRRRCGYRRLHFFLGQEGFVINHKKLRRLYREEGLQVRRRGGHKRALGTRAPIALRQGPNQRWSLDFQSDALADGRRFRIFAVVDDFTRECLALIADTSLSSLRVVRELDPSRCFAEPTRLKSTQDSTHRWMKLGAQVTLIAVRQVRANYEHPHRSISAHRSVHFRTFQACFRPR